MPPKSDLHELQEYCARKKKKHDDTHHYSTKQMRNLSILITWNIASFTMDTGAVVLVVHLECLVHSCFKFVFFTWWFVFDLITLKMFLKFCKVSSLTIHLSSPRRLTAWQDEQNASCPLQQIPNSDVESGRALQRRQRNKSASLMYMYLCNLSCSNKNVITWISPEYSASQVTMSCRNVTSGLLHMTVRRTLRFTLLAFSSLNDLSFFFFFSFVWQYMIYVNTVSLMSSNSSVASYRSRALFQTFDNLSIYLTETHMSCHCPCHNGSPWPPTSLHEV